MMTELTDHEDNNEIRIHSLTGFYECVIDILNGTSIYF
jgi:hypothetical protein